MSVAFLFILKFVIGGPFLHSMHIFLTQKFLQAAVCRWGKIRNVVYSGKKGQCHEIFYFRFLHGSVSPKSPVSNFLENSRRYSQLKVHHRWHRWQMKKKFNQKNFHYFFWTPLGSRVSIKINFFFKFIFKCQQFDHYSHCLPAVLFTPVANLPPMSLIPVAIFHWCQQYWRQICHRCQFATSIDNTSETGGKICRRCRWYQWQIWDGVVDTCGNFAGGVVDTGGKSATGVIYTCGVPWLANIYANFREKKIETVLMEYSRAGLKLIHEKTRKKSRDTVPLSPPLGQNLLQHDQKNCLMVPIFHVNSNSVPKTYYTGNFQYVWQILVQIFILYRRLKMSWVT